MSRITVRDIMQTKIVTISESDSLSTFEDIMTLGHVRHMPVVRGGLLVGVVSERDLLRVSLSPTSMISGRTSGAPFSTLWRSSR